MVKRNKMRIIFHNRQLNLLSQIIANMYLQYDKNQPGQNLLKNIKLDLLQSSAPPGKLIYIANDQFDNEVYLFGTGQQKKIVCQSLMGFNRIFSNNKQLVYYDLSQYNNKYLKTGIFLSRIKFKKIAQMIYLKGFRKQYQQVIDDITKFKQEIEKM